MKKAFLLFAFVLGFATLSSANDAELFSYNENEVAAVMSDVNFSSSDLGSVNSLEPNVLVSGSLEPLGIPAFIWGCVGGIAGVAIVHFIEEDKDETKMALWGCVAQSVVGTIVYIVAFASAANAATSGI